MDLLCFVQNSLLFTLIFLITVDGRNKYLCCSCNFIYFIYCRYLSPSQKQTSFYIFSAVESTDLVDEHILLQVGHQIFLFMCNTQRCYPCRQGIWFISHVHLNYLMPSCLYQKQLQIWHLHILFCGGGVQWCFLGYIVIFKFKEMLLWVNRRVGGH